MKRENQIGWIAICGTFLLYPILPQYIYIFKGLNIVNFCGALTIVSAIIGGVIYKCKIPYLIFHTYCMQLIILYHTVQRVRG